MAENGVADEKSDGLDIVSIGKLYQGPWEKKYWSSSRGKDRYPYPVGYVAVRTNNGNTYKMAILEGLKGPEFLISSTDGQSCSGQTPDIAWEGFQKKGCIRIKFWRGKRFSCKIDGAELFGFKNPLVKKLLRELKANCSQITEQSLPSSSFGNEQSEETHQRHAPDLQVKLVKTHGKEKRSKKRKEINVGLVIVDEQKRGRPQDLSQSGDGSHCWQSCEGNHDKGIPSHLLNSNENNTSLEQLADNDNISSHSLSAEDGQQFDSSISSEHIEKEKCLAAQEAGNSVSSKDVIPAEESTNLLNNQEKLDVSLFTNTPGFTSSKIVDEKADQPFQKDSQMLDDIDLYAPDTLDLTLDSTRNPEEMPEESNCTRRDKLNAAQILVSEKCVTESHSKDEMVIAGGSENSDKSFSDSVGLDITKSMMTLLLPRALPLLKTFSRKKRTSPNRGKKDLHAISQEERKGTNQCPESEDPAKSSEQIQLEKLNGEVHIPDKLFAENKKIEKQNENVLLPTTDMSSLVPGLEDSTTFAPDSFENEQCEIMECSQVGQVQDAVKAGQTATDIDSCIHEGDICCPIIQPNEEVGQSGKTISKTKSNQDVDCVLEKYPQRGDRNISSCNLGVSAGNMDSMLSVDHIEENGVLGSTGEAADGSMSSMPICRDSKCDFVMEISATNVSPSDFQTDPTRADEIFYRHPTEGVPTGYNGTSCVMAPVATHQDDALSPNCKFTSNVCGTSVNCEEQSQASEQYEIQSHHDIDGLISISQDQSGHYDMNKMVHNDKNAKDELTKMLDSDELQNIFELVGCYLHPKPISMVMLRTVGNEVFICVLSGYLMEKERTLFIYKVSIKGERRGSPTFIGHTIIIAPISRNACGGQNSLDSSSLQFTPDGKSLVSLNYIKVPYCREGNVNCQCSLCTSDCFEKNAVKVVQVKPGYVEAVCKLKTTNSVCCILVCEPSYLVATEECGRMNLWTMNSTWSTSTEHSYLPASDFMPNYIIEMKRIPNFPALIVGHSVYGDFYLWDLTRRILVSKFSAPRTSFLPFFPINLYRCPSQAFPGPGACKKKEVVDIMEERQTWSIESDNHASLPVDEEDLSLVLLVSSVSNLDLDNGFPYKDAEASPVGCWSLALLAKGKLISEHALDPSATIAGASAGYGIIGTCDGSLFVWELSTGTKLGYLSRCRGAMVSCLAVDDSESGAFAMAIDCSQLQVYAPASKEHD